MGLGQSHSLCGCHGTGLDATILSSGVNVLAAPEFSVAFCVGRMRCHGDSVSQVPLCSVQLLGFRRVLLESTDW